MSRPSTDPDPDPADDYLRGLPQVPGGAWGPTGQISQAEKFATGLRQARSGWRRMVFRTCVAFLAVVAVAVATFAIYAHFQ